MCEAVYFIEMAIFIVSVLYGCLHPYILLKNGFANVYYYFLLVGWLIDLQCTNSLRNNNTNVLRPIVVCIGR